LRVMAPRSLTSIKERYRKIAFDLNLFTRHYKRALTTPQSGFIPSEATVLQQALELWQEEKGTPFLYAHVVHILQVLAKFDPTKRAVQELLEDPEGGAPIQGANLPRPMGSKATKRLEKANRSETAGLNGKLDLILEEFKKSNQRSQRDDEVKQREKGIKQQMDKAKLCIRLGNPTGAQEAYEKMVELERLHDLALAEEKAAAAAASELEVESEVEVVHVAPAAASAASAVAVATTAASTAVAAAVPVSFVTPPLTTAGSFLSGEVLAESQNLLLPDDEEHDEETELETHLETPYDIFDYGDENPSEDV
jgi:tetratricopeptide (TPR) repeat protein